MKEKTIREPDGWKPPQWLPFNPTKTYFKLAGLPAEELRRHVLGFLQSCMTGEREAGSDADALLQEYNAKMQRQRESGQRGGRTSAQVRQGTTKAPLTQPQGTLDPASATLDPPSGGPQGTLEAPSTDKERDREREGEGEEDGEEDEERGGGTARAQARARPREMENDDPDPDPNPAPADATHHPPPEGPELSPAGVARRLGYSVYAPVARSIALMLPKEISPARLYSVAALKELTPAELEGFVAHYSGRGWEFPTRREEKPRPITDKNLLSAISSWALKKDNYTQGGTRGTGNANRNRDRVFDPARPVQTQRGDIDYDPGF